MPHLWPMDLQSFELIMTSKPPTIDAEYRVAPLQPQAGDEAQALYESFVRLLVGAALWGSEELIQRARTWEQTHLQEEAPSSPSMPESELVILRHLVIGMLFLGPALLSRPLVSLVNVADRAVGLASGLMGPLMRLPFFRPAQHMWDAYQDRLVALLEAFIEKGRREEPRSRDMAQALIPNILDDTLIALSQEVEGVQVLVRDQVSRYLAYVQEHPEELEALVQFIGDRYLNYLQEENPEALQTLVQGQSMSLVGEITDELRARTVTADSTVELIVRGLLRRPPREELPLPPPEVLAQARFSAQEVLSRRRSQPKPHHKKDA